MLNRRDFLRVVGIGSAGAAAGFALAELNAPNPARLIPYLIPPEDIIPGVANWYASVCRQCGAGCGIVVKVMEGRAKKIEGNPIHPISKGGLCARGQAGLQVLYNPGRIKNPLRRIGERGKGEFQEITWEEGLTILSKNLKELRDGGEGDGLYLLTSPISGHLKLLLKNFMNAYGSSKYFAYELINYENLRFANNITFGQNSLPHYDIENTNLLLSFGADFLTTWISPVNYSYAYGHMRQGRPGLRGKVIQVEPRLSLTGANADEWVAVKPGTEGLLALAIAYEIVEGGYYKGEDRGKWLAALERFTPRDVAKVTEVAEERIIGIAREFSKTKPSLAIGGENVSSYENGVSNLVAINILNYLAGNNIGISGGIIPNRDIEKSSFIPVNSLMQDASKGKIKTLILYDTNPVFTTPGAVKVEGQLKNIPLIVSLSSFMDETTLLSDLILPTHTYLEDWGDNFTEPSVGYPVATIMQPAVNPVFNTKSVGDIFIHLARNLAGVFQKEIPWTDFGAYLQASWKMVYNKHKDMKEIRETTFEEFWNNLLSKGGWWKEESQAGKKVYISVNKITPYLPKGPASFDGDDKDYPFYLTLYPHSSYMDGRGANLPWLQELPDAMTSVVWGTWIEMNPERATTMGIKEGDVIEVESPFGKIYAPVCLYAGQRPDTISIPIGQGHKFYGKYAEGRGANPLDLLPFKVDERTGAVSHNSTKVKITKTNSPGRLVKMAGWTKELGRDIVQTITPEEFQVKEG